MNYLQALEADNDKIELNRRLELLAKTIVDQTRERFTDDICVELFARAIIQITRIQVEKAKILNEQS